MVLPLVGKGVGDPVRLSQEKRHAKVPFVLSGMENWHFMGARPFANVPTETSEDSVDPGAARISHFTSLCH